MRLRWGWTSAFASVAILGCNALLQIEDVGFAPADSGALEGDPGDAAGGSDGGNDGATGDADAGVVFHAVDDPKYWTFSEVPLGDASVGGYSGTVFDGTYLYLVPAFNGVAMRYDTRTPFATTGGWKSFDLSTLVDGGGALPYFAGGAFDGRYVYFAPYLNGQSGVTRYDTQSAAGFASAASWEVFYMETVSVSLKGYQGAVFADPYVYFVPQYGVDTQYHGNVVRYDKRKPFGAAGSWEFTDLKPAHGVNAVGYSGAVLAGKELYLVPGSLFGRNDGFAARYDTTKAFAADAGGWSLLDVQGAAFLGGAFDGRHVYLAPCCGDAVDPVLGKVFARHDTTPATDAGVQWSLFNSGALALPQPGTAGAVFDGRHVLFAPSYLAPGGRNTSSGVVASYDTTGPFTSKLSWTQIDLVDLDARAKYFGGAAFDGQYVYLVPAGDGPVARFEARNTRAPFDLSFASFF